MEKKKILITAGGTGGHIIPAIALYNYLKKKGHQVIIVSDTRGEKFLRYFTNLKPKIIRKPRPISIVEYDFYEFRLEKNGKEVPLLNQINKIRESFCKNSLKVKQEYNYSYTKNIQC